MDFTSNDRTLERSSVHPAAQRLIRDDWVFDIVRDSPPFGTDAGWEALDSLRRWLAEERGDATEFLLYYSSSYDGEPPRPGDPNLYDAVRLDAVVAHEPIGRDPCEVRVQRLEGT